LTLASSSDSDRPTLHQKTDVTKALFQSRVITCIVARCFYSVTTTRRPSSSDQVSVTSPRPPSFLSLTLTFSFVHRFVSEKHRQPHKTRVFLPTYTTPRNPNMSFNKLLSKVLVPHLERDLSRSIGAEMTKASAMVDNLLAPTAYAYLPKAGRAHGGGAFSSTHVRQVGASQDKIKVYYPLQRQGLFRD
jgi:hypothetical protein